MENNMQSLQQLRQEVGTMDLRYSKAVSELKGKINILNINTNALRVDIKRIDLALRAYKYLDSRITNLEKAEVKPRDKKFSLLEKFRKWIDS